MPLRLDDMGREISPKLESIFDLAASAGAKVQGPIYYHHSYVNKYIAGDVEGLLEKPGNQ